MIAIEIRHVSAEKVLIHANSGPVISQALEGGTGLVSLLKLQPFLFAGKVTAVRMPAPCSGFQVLQPVQDLSAFFQFRRRQRAPDDCATIEIEKVAFQIRARF